MRIVVGAPQRVLHRSVLDLIYLSGAIALFAVVALIGRAVEKL